MEISQYLDFDFLIRFLEGLQKFLGENSEILIHDYRKGYDHTIVYALNPAVSGRAVGGSPKGGMITQLGKDIEPMKDSIQTFSNGPKDRFYKSFTTLIPDENGKDRWLCLCESGRLGSPECAACAGCFCSVPDDPSRADK